jgi:aspartyl-tRNA synthetase
MLRSHTCGELTTAAIGQNVRLIGWVDSCRDHGGITFVDLRDREGLTQLVFDLKNAAALFPASIDISKENPLKPESVIEVRGVVAPRAPGTENAKLKTGQIEVRVEGVKIHNVAQTPPFPLDEIGSEKVNEDLRLTYRYLDLRRRKMHEAMKIRHLAAQATRQYLNAQGFYEIETPTLFKSTPEGAREFLVPSRFNPGQFYALTQSPQQFKQMLMVAGMEKYYQLARCYRDENLRADRQLEFTQIDIEMSFIDREDIYALIEGLMKAIWKGARGIELQTPFPHYNFKDVMNRFGIDKPDTRFGLELKDVTDLFKTSGFKVFADIASKGGTIKALNGKGLAEITQGELKNLEETAKSMGAKGLAFIRVEKVDGKVEWKSPIVKFFSEEEKSALGKIMEIEEGDIIFFSAAPEWTKACEILGKVRLDCAQLLIKRGKLTLNPDQFNFLWVVDFPLMSYDEEKGGYVSSHHPFTAPVDEDIPLLKTDPLKVRGKHYDLVLNGFEIAGGSIRIHQPELQKIVFEEVLKIKPEVVKSRFGYMLDAFSYGAPPHGGIAPGFDRLVAILCGVPSIRDVIAFPKTQKGQCLMTASPSFVTDKQLQDLNIRLSDEVLAQMQK